MQSTIMITVKKKVMKRNKLYITKIFCLRPFTSVHFFIIIKQVFISSQLLLLLFLIYCSQAAEITVLDKIARVKYYGMIRSFQHEANIISSNTSKNNKLVTAKWNEISFNIVVLRIPRLRTVLLN